MKKKLLVKVKSAFIFACVLVLVETFSLSSAVAIYRQGLSGYDSLTNRNGFNYHPQTKCLNSSYRTVSASNSWYTDESQQQCLNDTKCLGVYCLSTITPMYTQWGGIDSGASAMTLATECQFYDQSCTMSSFPDQSIQLYTNTQGSVPFYITSSVYMERLNVAPIVCNPNSTKPISDGGQCWECYAGHGDCPPGMTCQSLGQQDAGSCKSSVAAPPLPPPPSCLNNTLTCANPTPICDHNNGNCRACQTDSECPTNQKCNTSTIPASCEAKKLTLCP